MNEGSVPSEHRSICADEGDSCDKRSPYLSRLAELFVLDDTRRTVDLC